MAKALLGIIVIASTVPFLAGHSDANESSFDVRFVAQDKISFEVVEEATVSEASSTFDSDDEQTGTSTDEK